jgi:MFS family permease
VGITGSARPREHQGFGAFWAAWTVSNLGTHVTTLALQVLVVVTLHASATEVGLVTGVRWLPYLLVGMIAGVLADRYRRRPILIGTDLGRAVVLSLIPLLVLLDALTIPALLALLLVFGTFSVLGDAAHQSFLPRLVSQGALTSANARLEQSAAVAQTSGPVLSGALIGLIGAPLAILVDAASYLASGLILTTVRVDEPRGTGEHRHLWRELRAGLSYVYRHPILAPYALTSHAWFVLNNLLGPVFVSFVLRDLGFSALRLGLAYAVGGVGGVLGSALSSRAATRFGVGRVVIVDRFLSPVSFVPVVLAAAGPGAWPMIALGQFVFWFAVGLGGPVELGYRQAVTPDHLRGRMNATIRSMNWGLTSIGAFAGGLLGDTIGYRPTLWLGITALTGVGVLLALSRFREAV